MSDLTNALEDLVLSAQRIKEAQPPEHPRVRSGMVAEEMVKMIAEFLGQIDAGMDAGISREALERYPLFTSITWEPPTEDNVHLTGVGAAFELSTLVGPRFTILVMPMMVTTPPRGTTV